jgi:hypothetical protein
MGFVALNISRKNSSMALEIMAVTLWFWKFETFLFDPFGPFFNFGSLFDPSVNSVNYLA